MFLSVAIHSCVKPMTYSHLCGRAVFFPAVWLCATVFTRSSSPAAQLPVLAVALLQPAAILIDHGHFQYNNLGLGLSVSFREHVSVRCAREAWQQAAQPMLTGTFGQAAAAALVALKHDVLGSVLYTLAVNHKLMCVYYAPAFFGHLLGRCLQRPTLLRKVRVFVRLHNAPIKGYHGFARRHNIATILLLCRCMRSRSWG